MAPRKYVSITELLDDFSLDESIPVGGNAPDRAQRPRGRARANKRLPARSGRRVLSSQQYVNISCRFVVLSGTPLPSPDEIIDPNAILRTVAEPTGCPICLETATVPRMLSCGHIMCLPCFFRFLKYAEDRVCPVCSEPVPRRVTSVSFLPQTALDLPTPGRPVTLQLMSRGYTGFPSPVHDSDEAGDAGVRHELKYARIAVGNEEYCRSESAREVRDLQTVKLLNSELCGDDEGFAEALDACRADIAAAHAVCSARPPSRGLQDADRPLLPLEVAQPAYFYYQTAFESPTTFVLAPLDIAVLKASFGDYAAFPPVLMPKVDNVVYKTIDEDVRKRMKFLSHIPTDAPIGMLECDWRGILPEHVTRKYGKQLAERRKRRKTQDRRDDQRRQRAELESDSRMRAEVLVDSGPAPQANINMAELPTLGTRPSPVVREAKWVDTQAEYDEMMANAVVTKRGRRKIILSSNH